MAFLLYFTAIVLSGIAAYYSVIGLIAIFSAAALPVAIMGGSLEAAKLVVASWLYRYWRVIPVLMRGYFVTALLILMLITSMGIFGFLSKAHNDQNLVSGDVLAKIAIYDEKIKIAKENIDANRRSLKQMDEAVDQTMGRSTTEQGADKAVQIRRSQARERTRLLQDTEAEQKKITQLNEARAPIAAEVRKVEAEVGPLKYIAALIYDDTADTNTLERAVRWLIIMLIVVFDPLAVLMLIAANLTQIKGRQLHQEPPPKENMINLDRIKGLFRVKKQEPEYPADDGALTDKQVEQIKETAPRPVEAAKPVEQVYLKRPWVDKVPGIRFPHQVGKMESIPKEEPKHDPSKFKIIPDQTELPVVVETAPKQETPGVDQSTASTIGYDTEPAVEEVGIKNKKVKKEKNIKDKSISGDGFIAKPITVDDQVQQMIDTNDQQGLEQVYKKIVKELAKNNRSKSTHWGPIKNTKR